MFLTKNGESAITISIYPNRPCFDSENLDLDRLLKHSDLTLLQRETLFSAGQMIEAVVQDLGGLDEASWYGSAEYEPLKTFGDGRKPFFVTRGTKLGELLDIDIEIQVEEDAEGAIIRRISIAEDLDSKKYPYRKGYLTLADFTPRPGWFVGKAFGFTNTNYAHACRWIEAYQGLQVAHVAEAIAFLEAHPHCVDGFRKIYDIPVRCPSNKDFCYEPFVNLAPTNGGEQKYRLTESGDDETFYLIGIKRVAPPDKR